jgi:hypothetical protein
LFQLLFEFSLNNPLAFCRCLFFHKGVFLTTVLFSVCTEFYFRLFIHFMSTSHASNQGWVGGCSLNLWTREMG